jgi:hypothetical protein
MPGFQKTSHLLNHSKNPATLPQQKTSDMIVFRALLLSLSAVSAFAVAVDTIVARSELTNAIAVSDATNSGISRLTGSNKAEYCYLCSDGLG